MKQLKKRMKKMGGQGRKNIAEFNSFGSSHPFRTSDVLVTKLKNGGVFFNLTAKKVQILIVIDAKIFGNQ